MVSSAIEPFPPAAVDEWIGALKGGHASLNTLTTDQMMLALANSARLGEVCTIINEPSEGGEGSVNRKMELMGNALTKLAANGHPQEAAKVDAAVVGGSPRIRWSNAVYDSALRLADAGENDALVRLAETLMLVPGSDRTKEFDIKREQSMSVRSIEMAPIDNPSLPRTTTLLPILVRVGAIARFRELAEMRVAAVPEDFKSVRVLTLATLLDTGDDPALWTRISDAEGFFRGRDFVALKDSMQLCYQFRIPAPHLCERAERMYDEADHYGTSFQRHEFALILAALCKDSGQIDEAKRLQADALSSLSDKGTSACARIFEKYAGVLAVSLDDERMLPELDGWIERFSEALEDDNGYGDKYYRHALIACEWALALELPEPVRDRWFRFADEMAGYQLVRIEAQERPEAYAIRWHLNLLLSAGMHRQAEELLASFMRAIEGKEVRGCEPEGLRALVDAASQVREPLVLPDAAGEPIFSVRWTEGKEYLSSSGKHVLIADVFPDSAAAMPGGGGEAEYSVLPTVLGANLIPSEWRWHRGSTSSSCLVPWENEGGSIRIGYRGGYCGGYGYEIWSGEISLEPEHDYLLSGRIRALGRGGVKIQFLAADGSIVSTEKITEQLSTSSPGERWFRVNLVRGEGVREGMRVPQQADSVRLILTNSLSVQNRWSDLFVGRLVDVD